MFHDLHNKIGSHDAVATTCKRWKKKKFSEKTELEISLLLFKWDCVIYGCIWNNKCRKYWPFFTNKNLSKSSKKLIIFILMLPYSIHRKTQRDPNVLTKTFLVDTKKWDSNIVMIYINSHMYVKILDLLTVLNQIICDYRSGNFYTRTQTRILW